MPAHLADLDDTAKQDRQKITAIVAENPLSAAEKQEELKRALNSRVDRLIAERFRDFGSLEIVKGLTNAKGDKLGNVLAEIRAKHVRVKDEAIKKLRKEFAPAGTIEADLKIRCPEDVSDWLY